jgi:hypothetical protein
MWLQFTMAEKYNVGVVSADGLKTPLFTKDVKIVALPAAAGPGEAAAMTLDYFFNAADLNGPDKYFIYDPKVKASVTAAVRVAALAKKIYDAVKTNSSLPVTTPKPSSASSIGSSGAVTALMAMFTVMVHRLF